MKKLLIAIIAFLAISVATVEAQPRAIGARVGYGVEVSYQHSVGKNMVSIEAGTPGFWGVETVFTYNWLFPIKSWEHAGTWNWFVGVGAGGGWSWWGVGWVGVAGRIGVEYNFKFPLQLSLDWRPLVGPSFDYGGYYNYYGNYYGNTAIGFYTGGLYVGAIACGVRYYF